MSKILYIAPYRQMDKWGRLSRDVIQSFRQANVEFMLRPINYIGNNLSLEFPEEDTKVDYDAIVQTCLPSHFYYDASVKNIFMYDPETTDIHLSNIMQTLLLADEVWCTRGFVNEELKEHGVNSKYCDLSLSVASNYQLTPQEDELRKNLTGITKTFYCNVSTENSQSIATIKEAFYIAFNANPNIKLILGVESIEKGKEILHKKSTTLSTLESNHIILVTLGADFRNEALIQLSDVVISTSPFINTNYTIAEAVNQNKLIISNLHGFGLECMQSHYLVADYPDSCTVDISNRGTTDFGNTNETVFYVTKRDLSNAMLKTLHIMYDIEYKTESLQNKNKLYGTNMESLV